MVYLRWPGQTCDPNLTRLLFCAWVFCFNHVEWELWAEGYLRERGEGAMHQCIVMAMDESTSFRTWRGFPPAALYSGLAEVAIKSEFRGVGAYSWALGCFVVIYSRLVSFHARAMSLCRFHRQSLSNLIWLTKSILSKQTHSKLYRKCRLREWT